MGLLEKYQNDVKKVPVSRLPDFCGEIRAFLLKNISVTGGHLASNLGVVELTVALHRVFDTSRDRVVFDVGHQCYAHKLLTGRREGFPSMRALGAMSGFPKPVESVHDAFMTGHASTSVSAALGMARARTLLGENYNVVAVLGDGALTGGIAYEGMNDAGQSGEPMIVILNDNGMSITKNVGGVARHLSQLRLKPTYFEAKRVYHKVLDPVPGGRFIDKMLRAGKQVIKDAVLPGSMFAQMGFEYLGPTDGHDVEKITYLLRQALERKKPTLIHLITKKGKGYPFSEKNPSAFHGVGAFSLESGVRLADSKPTYSTVFGQKLVSIAEKNRRVCAITAAMQAGTGLDGFAKRFPKRFFDVGIAEEHAVTMAAGMAKQGLRPVVAVYSTFFQRAYDQIVHDVALQRLPVVLAVDHAGLVGEDGETHHGLFDPLFLGSVPGIEIWSPASFAELGEVMELALESDGPVAVRYPRGGEGAYKGSALQPTALSFGTDATIVTYGRMTDTALEAARLLAAEGIFVTVVKIARLKPLDTAAITALCSGEVYLLEDCAGYLDKLIAGTPLNTGDRFVPHGSVPDLMHFCGLDSWAVASRIAGRPIDTAVSVV